MTESDQNESPGEPELGTVLQQFFADLHDDQASALPLPRTPLPDMVLGDYRLVREIGRGGMGSVWEAEQLSLHRTVALKLLAPSKTLSEHSLKRFRREAEAGGRLNHRGIVAVYAVGEADGFHYIAQELVPGGATLVDLLEQAQGMSGLPATYYRDMATLFAAVAQALQVAHDAGVIHRDIKPANILLGADGQPRVADFGVAKLVDEMALSQTGDVSGTTAYMSPEQVSGAAHRVDYRTDIFSVGVTLYEALTLRRAFEGDTSQQVGERVRHEEPPEPRTIRSGIPRELSIICQKAMEKNPGHRYGSMAAFELDLRRFLRNEPLDAKPATVFQRSVKWVQRHRVLSSTALSGVVVLAVLAVLLIVNNQARLDAVKANTRLSETLKQRDAALTRSRLAEAKALEEARASQAAVDFLAKSFRIGDPKETWGYSVPLGVFLEMSAKQVLGAFQDSPNSRAVVMEAIGRALQSIGRPKQALPLLEESLAVYEAQDVDRVHRTLPLHQSIAFVQFALGRFDDAESHLYKLEAALRGDAKTDLSIDERDGALLLAQTQRSMILQARGNLEEAERIAKAAMDEARSKPGLGSSVIFGVASVLSRIYAEQGRLEESLAALEAAVGALMESQDGIEPSTLALLSLAGLTLHERGDSQRALEVLEFTLGQQESQLDEEHPDTLLTAQRLGTVQLAFGKIAEARQVLKRVYVALAEQRGAQDPATLAALSQVMSAGSALAEEMTAAALQESQSGVAAEALMRVNPDFLSLVGELAAETQQAYESFHYRHEGETEFSVSCLVSLASYYCWLPDQESRVEGLYERAIEGYASLLGDSHPKTLQARRLLAQLYQRQGRFKEADDMQARVLESCRKAFGPRDATTLEVMQEWAMLLAMRGNHARAIDLVEELLALTATGTPEHEFRSLLLNNIRTAQEEAELSGDG